MQLGRLSQVRTTNTKALSSRECFIKEFINEGISKKVISATEQPEGPLAHEIVAEVRVLVAGLHGLFQQRFKGFTLALG